MKNIFLLFVIIFNVLLSRTNSWGLDITAQAENNSGEMLGISDYIRLKMEAAEPFFDCGIDQCCDKYESYEDLNGNGINDDCYCIQTDLDCTENPEYVQGDDPNNDNYHPLDNPTGYEKNNQWDGDIFNDVNQDCIADENEIIGYNFIDRVGWNGILNNEFDNGEIYINLDQDGIEITINTMDINYDGIINELDYPGCKFEEGGNDGWRQGEDEFDIPAPMDGHTNIRFSHLDWMNEYDINGNQCCMEGIFFSVDKKSWKNHDEVAQWDIYGNTWQLNDINRIKFTWDLDSLFWIDDLGLENNYEIYIFTDDNNDGKFNQFDTHVNMNTSHYFAVDPELLISSGEGAKISIVLGECALQGTDEYKFDNDGDGLASCNNTDGSECPREFCPDAHTGEYYTICKDEFCIQDGPQQINCPENFSYERLLNVRSINIDIENDSLSTQDESYVGGGDGQDEYLTVCRYNKYIKQSELGQVYDEFIVEGDNEGWLFLDYQCDLGEPNCNENNINENVWIQKWYKIDEIVEEDVNDMIYCPTNQVDDCNICAIIDENGDGIYEDYNANLDCTNTCFGTAYIDECGICSGGTSGNPLGNMFSNSPNFLDGPNVDCNGECELGTPTYDLKHSQGNLNYGEASINSCGICVNGNTINQDQGEIDECDVCPPAIHAEPFHDENGNHQYDLGEDFLDKISDGIYTQINNEYFFGANACWIDENNNGQWDNEEPYIDENNNGQYDQGEPISDLDNNGIWTDAEDLRLPGDSECIQGDSNYTYLLGSNCDGECFNSNFTIYSEAFYDDCGDCSCIDGLSNNNDSFCFSNHLPNSGNSDLGTSEYPNSCTDSLFYFYDNVNDLLVNGVQEFTALSRPLDDDIPGDIDSVILSWNFYSDIQVDSIGFIILNRNPDDSTEWNDEPIDSICCLNNSYSIENTSIGEYGIKAFDRYGNVTAVYDSSIAEPYFDIPFILYHGNNLVSFPGIPNDASLFSAFMPIQDYITGIIGQAVASSHLGNGNWVGTISEINSFSGYWIEIDYEDINNDGDLNDTLLFELEQAYPANIHQIYNLQSGANLISYVGIHNILINNAIPDQMEKYFQSIISEGVAASQIDGDGDGEPDYWVGSLVLMKQKKGYWVILNLDGCLENDECYQDPFGNSILDFYWD